MVKDKKEKTFVYQAKNVKIFKNLLQD